MLQLSNKERLTLEALLVAAVAVAGASCRQETRRQVDSDTGLAGEPERYSATIIRSVNDGQPSVARFARLGAMTREEWSEAGSRRCVIWQPNLGKAFVLDLDRRVFVEVDIGSQPAVAGFPDPNTAGQPPSHEADEGTTGSERRDLKALDPEAVDRTFAEDAQPTRIEEQGLPDETIDGYQCVVIQRRVEFPGGRNEITRWFRARALGGLALRVESETQSETDRVRIVTERREINLEASPDLFVVPSDFKKVKGL